MSTKSEKLALMVNRENLYRFIARLYRQEIDQKTLERIQEMTFPDISNEKELSEGYRLLKESVNNSNHDFLTGLAVDYAKVFLGAGISEGQAAFPYESVYTSKKRIMMQDAWEQVRGVYAAKGLSKDILNWNLHEDHIALELEYMAYLCKEAQADLDNPMQINEQKEFLEQHLLNWVPEFCKAIEKYATTQFYKGTGKITLGFLNLDRKILESLL